MVLRCPSCNLPLTKSEAHSGACPWCHKSLGSLEISPSKPEGRSASSSVRVRKKLGFWALFGILFACGIVGAIIHAALVNFRSGAGVTGGLVGMFLAYGVLHGLGYIGKKESA